MSTAALESSPASPALLDINDLAARLRLSHRTIWRMRDRGIMPPSFNVGKSVRWHADQIDAWITKGCPALQRNGSRS